MTPEKNTEEKWVCSYNRIAFDIGIWTLCYLFLRSHSSHVKCKDQIFREAKRKWLFSYWNRNLLPLVSVSRIHAARKTWRVKPVGNSGNAQQQHNAELLSYWLMCNRASTVLRKTRQSLKHKSNARQFWSVSDANFWDDGRVLYQRDAIFVRLWSWSQCGRVLSILSFFLTELSSLPAPFFLSAIGAPPSLPRLVKGRKQGEGYRQLA